MTYAVCVFRIIPVMLINTCFGVQAIQTGVPCSYPEIALSIFIDSINVITIDATETVDVGTMGTSNDPNGYLAAASLATAGLVYGSLADGAVTRGALLYEITEATTAAARMPDITAGGDPISYTCSAGSDTAVFDIIIEYVEVVTEA